MRAAIFSVFVLVACGDNIVTEDPTPDASIAVDASPDAVPVDAWECPDIQPPPCDEVCPGEARSPISDVNGYCYEICRPSYQYCTK